MCACKCGVCECLCVSRYSMKQTHVPVKVFGACSGDGIILNLHKMRTKFFLTVNSCKYNRIPSSEKSAKCLRDISWEKGHRRGWWKVTMVSNFLCEYPIVSRSQKYSLSNFSVFWNFWREFQIPGDILQKWWLMIELYIIRRVLSSWFRICSSYCDNSILKVFCC